MSSTFSRQHRHHGRPLHRGKPRARSDGYRAALTVQMRADRFLDLMVTASKETNPTDPAPITKDTMALVAATFNHSYRDHCVSFAVLGGEEGSQVPNVQPALLHQVQDGYQDHPHLVHGTHRSDPPHPHERGAQPRAMQHLHRQPLSECRVANSSASWTRSTTSTTPMSSASVTPDSSATGLQATPPTTMTSPGMLLRAWPGQGRSVPCAAPGVPTLSRSRVLS